MKRLAVSVLALAIIVAIAGCSGGKADEFATDKTVSTEVSDIVFEMPGYYKEAKSEVPEGYAAWFAGSEKNPNAMLITANLKGLFDSEEAFGEGARKTTDDVLAGFDVRAEDIDLDESIEIAGQTGMMVAAEGQYGGQEQRFRTVLFFNSATNETGLLVLLVKKGEEHDFESDFATAMESASLSENAQSLISKREEEQAEAERAAQEEAEQKAKEEEAKRKAQEEDKVKEDKEKRIKAELEACIGKTADEARDAAVSADYSAKFKDENGETVTFYVVEGDESLQIHDATVTGCDLSSWSPEVTFALEYIHPTPESCVDRPLLEVADELKAAGVGFVLIHAKSGQDMTSSYEFGDFNESDMVITKAQKEFGSGNGSSSAEEFTLTIISQADLDAANEKRRIRETLESKLDHWTAWFAAKDYGQWMYGDGFDLDWLFGQLAEEAEDEDTWFLKAYCTLDGEQYNCEARVTGTEDSPQVIYFEVY